MTTEGNPDRFHDGAGEAVMPEPIFESYKEQVVDFRGVSLPLGTMFNLCPEPRENMTPEKIERYAAKILAEAGVEDPRIEAWQNYQTEQEPKNPDEDAKTADAEIAAAADEANAKKKFLIP